MSKERDDILRQLDELPVSPAGTAQTPWQNMTLLSGVKLLTRAVVGLDATSSRLALANIVLSIVLAMIGGFQIWLMLKGH